MTHSLYELITEVIVEQYVNNSKGISDRKRERMMYREKEGERLKEKTAPLLIPAYSGSPFTRYSRRNTG